MDGEDPAARKAQLRRRMRRLRAGISGEAADRTERSARLWRSVVDEIAERVSAANPAVMLFESYPTEPDTAQWLADSRARGWQVFIPEVDGKELRILPGDIDPQVLDVVVVPGLAFTPDGRRLGQGGGHYDRLIARLGPHCLAIGVCYAEQLLEELPTEAHDRTVDVVVTDADENPVCRGSCR
ncbi:hypothetical protein BH20ACT4_BH20ACT4_14390 [soil metagenome]